MDTIYRLDEKKPKVKLMKFFSWELIYLGIFFETLILSLILTPLAEIIGFKYKFVDKPSNIKVHTNITARSGGIAIYFAFIIALLADVIIVRYFLINADFVTDEFKVYLRNMTFTSGKLLAIISGATFIFLVGIIDDRFSLGAWTKLFLQIISTVPLLLADIRIVMFIPYPIFGHLLTIFWVVLLTNSFNFLDNMNGLTSGIAAIVLLALSFISYQSGELFMTMISLALCGSIFGFWRYNFFKGHPFMGDGGSLFIGYLIAAFTIMATYWTKENPTSLPVLMPFIVLGVPLFDTATVLWIRYKRGVPLMKGDKNHFSHRLADLGMSKRSAVLFIYLITVCVALNAILIRYLPLKAALICGIQTMLIFVLIYILERVSANKKT